MYRVSKDAHIKRQDYIDLKERFNEWFEKESERKAEVRGLRLPHLFLSMALSIPSQTRYDEATWTDKQGAQGNIWIADKQFSLKSKDPLHTFSYGGDNAPRSAYQPKNYLADTLVVNPETLDAHIRQGYPIYLEEARISETELIDDFVAHLHDSMNMLIRRK